MNKTEKIVTIGDQKVKLKTAPATVGYEVAMKLQPALASNDIGVLTKCVYELLKFCELDLGDGRAVTLDNAEMINQHFGTMEMLQLQNEVLQFNFGFLMNGAPSVS